MLLVQVSPFLDALVLADGDVLHLRRDDAFARIVQLGHVLAFLGLQWLFEVLEAQAVKLLIMKAFLSILGADALHFLHIAAVQYPLLAQGGKASLYVNVRVGVGVGAAGVVHRHGRVLLRLG